MSVRNELVRIILTVVALLSFFEANTYASDKLKVAASFYPLAHFAEQVGGDLIEVINIMPPGAEPHEFEPTPRDIHDVYDSDIFIFHGGGLDPWAQKIERELEKEHVVVVEMFTALADLAPDLVTPDPHTWLDPVLAMKEVEIIRQTLVDADFDNKTIYSKNSDIYIKKLSALQSTFMEGLADCARREVIITHDAFSYLAKRYAVTTYAITGISPEEEPSLRKIAELTKLAISKNIKYIFFEELLSPALARTIAGETGAEMLVLNPLGGLTGKDIQEGRTYISVMEDNLGNLKTAMECIE